MMCVNRPLTFTYGMNDVKILLDMNTDKFTENAKLGFMKDGRLVPYDKNEEEYKVLDVEEDEVKKCGREGRNRRKVAEWRPKHSVPLPCTRRHPYSHLNTGSGRGSLHSQRWMCPKNQSIHRTMCDVCFSAREVQRKEVPHRPFRHGLRAQEDVRLARPLAGRTVCIGE
ncbi:Protein of unknown function [Gryllus bimaculatus]|nr:Protein of unknown function [Gryllus bimaculatus]